MITHRQARSVIYWNLVLAIVIFLCGCALYVRKLHIFDHLIVTAAQNHQLDPGLITSLIYTESRFNAECVGTSGEIGLMQVSVPAAQDWARIHKIESFPLSDLFKPDKNLEIGCWYLSRAVSRWAKNYENPLPYALAEYNAGRRNVLRWIPMEEHTPAAFVEAISFPTTKRYVQTILLRYRGYL